MKQKWGQLNRRHLQLTGEALPPFPAKTILEAATERHEEYVVEYPNDYEADK